MEWGCISAYGTSNLHIWNVTASANRYMPLSSYNTVSEKNGTTFLSQGPRTPFPPQFPEVHSLSLKVEWILHSVEHDLSQRFNSLCFLCCIVYKIVAYKICKSLHSIFMYILNSAPNICIFTYIYVCERVHIFIYTNVFSSVRIPFN